MYSTVNRNGWNYSFPHCKIKYSINENGKSELEAIKLNYEKDHKNHALPRND